MSIEPSYAAGGPRWLPRAERFVRHALLAEPAFLDLHRGGFFYPSLGNSEEMVNSTFPRPIGIDSSLCLLSRHTWRRILPRPIGIDSPLCLLSQHTSFTFVSSFRWRQGAEGVAARRLQLVRTPTMFAGAQSA